MVVKRYSVNYMQSPSKDKVNVLAASGGPTSY